VIDAVRPGRPSLLAHLGPRPIRIGTRTPGVGGPSPADLYLPAGGLPRRVILLIHGLNETGKDDARLVALARDLARARSAVFVPDFPNLRRLRVRPSDANGVVLAYADLAGRFAQLCRPGRADACGIISFSYGVGPALIAAADPRIRDRVGFAVAFGGYADLREVIRFVTTERASDPRVRAKPYDWARWEFLARNAELVADPGDQARLKEIAERKLDDPRADVRPIAGALGPEGGAVWDLLNNRDPARVDALLARESPAIRESIAALSPLARLRDVRARLILVHGVGDRSIPFTESERLARAAPDPARVSLTLTRVFGHVDPALPPLKGLAALRFYGPEAWRMIRVTWAILSQNCT
jgi:pimeloyl-ACP methyl ester carboxylesterase